MTVLNSFKIQKQNYLLNKKNFNEEKNRISIQKSNFINRLEQSYKDISREKEFLNDANKT